MNSSQVTEINDDQSKEIEMQELSKLQVCQYCQTEKDEVIIRYSNIHIFL